MMVSNPGRGREHGLRTAFVVLCVLAAAFLPSCGDTSPAGPSERPPPDPATVLDSVSVSVRRITLDALGDTARILVSSHWRSGDVRPISAGTWRSADETVARVAAGLVTSTGNGTTRITATVFDSIPVAVDVTVKQRVASVALTEAPPPFLRAGATWLAAVVATDSQGSPVPPSRLSLTWAVAAGAVATVDTTGRVNATGPGETTLTVTEAGGAYTQVPLAVRVVMGELAFLYGSGELHALDPAGGDIRLTPDGMIGPDFYWVPDGTAIHAVIWGCGLCEYKIGYPPKQLLTDFSGYVNSPAMSHDGKRIAFRDRPEYGVSDVWVADSDGTNPLRITDDEGDSLNPKWSWDDTRIAYIRVQSGVRSLVLMNSDGSDARVLDVPSRPVGMEWSPDGNALAVDDDNDVWIVQADGSGSRLVSADCPDRCNWARWAPDGGTLAYASRRRLHFVDLTTWTEVSTELGLGRDVRMSWTQSGRSVYVPAGMGSAANEIVEVALDGSVRHVLNTTYAPFMVTARPVWAGR